MVAITYSEGFQGISHTSARNVSLNPNRGPTSSQYGLQLAGASQVYHLPKFGPFGVLMFFLFGWAQGPGGLECIGSRCREHARPRKIQSGHNSDLQANMFASRDQRMGRAMTRLTSAQNRFIKRPRGSLTQSCLVCL